VQGVAVVLILLQPAGVVLGLLEPPFVDVDLISEAVDSGDDRVLAPAAINEW